jgi:GT2 family glycosyltransferase/glycosyltransferase involved in cell wall biosynthesis
MRIENTELQQAKEFVRTPSFALWQKYCTLRDYSRYRLGLSESIPERKQSVDNLKKYVIPSKAFALWKTWNATKQTLYLSGKKYLPSLLKRSLKQLRAMISLRRRLVIDRKSQLAWRIYAKRRLPNSLDILDFGVTTYDYRFQRPQQLAHALGVRGARVFYIDSEFSYAPSPALARLQVRSVGHNVFVVKLGAPRDYFIYRDRLSPQGIEVLMAELKQLFREVHIVNPLAKVDHPFWQPLVAKLQMPIVYDAMDLHRGFKETASHTETLESELARRADGILVSSRYLARTFQAYHNKVLLLPNAGDYQHFHQAPTARPPELSQLPGKIIGYYGAIAEWFDIQALRAILSERPDDSIVLIGRVQNQAVAALAARYQNLYLLGEKPYDSLPQYLHAFDVALIPFLLTPLIQATNPVKIYEYFAAGVPVVATKIPELEPYKKLLYLGTNPSHFAQLVTKALAEHDPGSVRARQQCAAKETWADRAAVLAAHLESYFPKVSVIILTYNHPELSRLTIQSVLKRSLYPNLEVIIVDNHSDKKTQQIVRAYRTVPGVKVIMNRRNLGFAAGNNVGMQAATGEYLVLLNNDTVVTPGWIERLVRHCQESHVGLVGPVTNNIGNESKIMIQYNPTNRPELEQAAAAYTYPHWGETLPLERIAAFCWMLPKRLYQELGGLDERFGRGLFEDDDYCQRVRRAGYKILCAEDSFVHHYGGASTVWESPAYRDLFAQNKALYEAKWGPWQPHRYRRGVT